MDFTSARPSVVKAIRQRDLLNVWLRLYARQHQLPAAEEFVPERITDEIQDLVYYTVDNTASPPRFRIESNGTRMASAYGATGRGRDLEEYLGAIRRPAVMPAYFKCVERALPVFTISMVQDVQGRPVAYERLLMPFSRRSETSGEAPGPTVVTDIIASLKTISEEGGFEIRNLMRGNEATPVPVLSTVIDSELFHRGVGSTTADDIEIG